jgi:hypothetical protein
MTEAQLTARRENAQHSTGPRTLEGRKRSSLNAFRHGLTGQIIVHTPEDREAFNKHCDGIREALAPVGALEIDLAQAIAEDRWRLNRARALENAIFALGQSEDVPQESDHPELDAALAQGRTWMAHAHQLQLLTTYEGRISRSVEKNMGQLRALQAERKASSVEAPHKLTAVRPEGPNDDRAGDLPPENPDSSVCFFKGHPASDQSEPGPLPEPATRPNRPDPQRVPPQPVSLGPTAKKPAATPWEPKPGEWVRNPIG